MKDDRVYLIHIGECIERIESYTRGGREMFLRETMTQDAVLRNLQTLSESTQNISDTLKGNHPEVDWRGIGAFRNVLVHDYLGVDVKRIWDIVTRDVPALKTARVLLGLYFQHRHGQLLRRPSRDKCGGKSTRRPVVFDIGRIWAVPSSNIPDCFDVTVFCETQ